MKKYYYLYSVYGDGIEEEIFETKEERNAAENNCAILSIGSTKMLSKKELKSFIGQTIKEEYSDILNGWTEEKGKIDVNINYNKLYDLLEIINLLSKHIIITG